jgi:hypothetical protein
MTVLDQPPAEVGQRVEELDWAHAAELARTAKLTVNCDSEVGAHGLSAAAAHDVTIGIQLEKVPGMRVEIDVVAYVGD